MASFIQRFLTDPGTDVLLSIESIDILDLEPPASISGVGTGTVLLVGEFENGPFNTPTEVVSANDLQTLFGSLGYVYDSTPGNNPCAVKRTADGGNAEAWNGNGIVQLNGKKFRRLVLCRADTSVGSVSFSRLAFLTGATVFRFDLEPAQNVVFEDSSGPDTATFSATAAANVSAAGVYPTLFVGGETLTLGYDAASNFTVNFLSSDQTHQQVIDRINQYAGFTFASISAPNVTTLTGKIRGLLGQVRIVSASAGVLAALGMTAGTYQGTGNVANIDAVQISEVDSIISAATSGNIRATLDSNGALRLYNTVNTTIRIVSQTALGLGLTQDVSSSSDTDKAVYVSAAGTYPTLFAGGETLTLGTGNDPNVTVTFLVADQTQAQAISRINTAMGYTCAVSLSATRLKLVSKNAGEDIRIVASSAAGVLTTLGLALKTIIPQVNANATLAAGTRVRVPSGQQFVTMQDVAVTADSAGPYTVKVRPAVDDGTGVSAIAGTVTEVQQQPAFAAFSVINLAPISAALSETVIDTKYIDAINATIDVSSICRVVNITFCARQSNVVRRYMRSNAIDASANGHFGRMTCIRPPLGTLKATAKSTAAEPGVGAYRDQRVIYNYPAIGSYVPAIATRGIAGGYGFTVDGIVDIGSDGFMASILSQLAPEENPGQQTPYTGAAIRLESSANAQNFTIDDYKAFKASGIAAPRFDDGSMVFQSGVTSVDPLLHPNLKTIARRRMADYIQDSLALRAKNYGKKLNRKSYRNAYVNEVINFLDGLLSPTNPESQRIDGYTVDQKTGNTLTTLAMGMFRIIISVRTLSSLDAIVLQTTIGEGVVITESVLSVNPG